MPTFGNTGTTSVDFADSSANTGAFALGTLTEDGDVSNITYRTRSESGTVHAKALIYTDNAGYPGQLKGVGVATNITTALQGYDLSFSSAVSLTAGTYWVGCVTDGVMRNYYDATGIYCDSPSGFSYSSPPTTFPGGGGAGDGAYEAYATYTTPSPVATVPLATLGLLGVGS